LIDEGIADINNTAPNASKPSADDFIYKGNTTNWKKAANTLKLKLYTQVRRVQNVSTQVQALLATPANLINSQAENFMMPYGPFGTTDDRHLLMVNIPLHSAEVNFLAHGCMIS
jgi:hypothetical protein